jgi:ABC-type transport system involved in multi-copper enzyme maturation permease subunit
VSAAPPPAGRDLWPTRRRQLGAVVRMELRRGLRSWRALWLYLLALAPLLPMGLHGLAEAVQGHNDHSLDEDTTIVAGIFHYFYLRVGIFFGCLGVFTRLYRGELMEKSLHHYLLAPVRRELLTAGKFIAGILTTGGVFTLALLLAFPLTYWHFGAEGWAFVTSAQGVGQLTAYLAITVLACVGYGSLFLLLGLVFKNPIVPAVTALAWETINPVLPGALKLLSVIFYLQPLLPVEVPTGSEWLALFAVPADPLSPWLALPGLLIVSAAILLVAALRARETEVNYSE